MYSIRARGEVDDDIDGRGEEAGDDERAFTGGVDFDARIGGAASAKVLGDWRRRLDESTHDARGRAEDGAR